MEKITSRENAKIKYACRLASSGAFRRSEGKFLAEGRKLCPELCRGAVLDLKDASLHYNSQKLELTKNEFRILQLLFERRGRTVPREDIMQALWESDSFIDDNTLTVNVARLRAHLAEIGLDMSRFPSAAHLCSWAGVCPGNCQSAGRRKHGKTINGNMLLIVIRNNSDIFTTG